VYIAQHTLGGIYLGVHSPACLPGVYVGYIQGGIHRVAYREAYREGYLPTHHRVHPYPPWVCTPLPCPVHRLCRVVPVLLRVEGVLMRKEVPPP